MTWIPLKNGYDATYDPVWLSAYTLGTPGNTSMFRHHEINLLQHFSAEEQIFVRFRMYTDGSVTGWGWAIDNLEIQERLTSVGTGTELPKQYALSQNFPNPFNPETEINYELPENSKIILKIYNIRGQEVRTLVNEFQKAGIYSLRWDGKSSEGLPVSSGVYLYRLESEKFTLTHKMVLMR